MDTGKVFPGLTMSKSKERSLRLSYRRYARLKDSQKRKFEKFAPGYSPMVWQIALAIKAQLGTPLKRKYFKIAQKWIESGDWDKVELNMLSNGFNCSQVNDRYLYKELIFQGFVDASSVKLNSKYGYFMTNRLVNNKLLVYPKKLGDSYYNLRKGKHPHFSSQMGLYGIPGIIRYSASSDSKRYYLLGLRKDE